MIINYGDKVLLKLIEAIVKHLASKFDEMPIIEIKDEEYVALKY